MYKILLICMFVFLCYSIWLKLEKKFRFHTDLAKVVSLAAMPPFLIQKC